MTNRATYSVVDKTKEMEGPGFEILRRRGFPIVPEAHPASCTTGCRLSLSVVKRPERGTTTHPLLASGSSITIPLPLHNQLYVSARASHFWVITLHIVFPQVVINGVRWSERLATGTARCLVKVRATCSR